MLCCVITTAALAGGYGGRYHYGGHYGYGHHGGGDEGAALLAGLVIGGLVGYFVNESRHHRPAYRHGRYYSHRYDDHGYDRLRYSRRPAYRHDSYRPEVVRREVVRLAPRARRSPAEGEFAGAGCRMTREYTTTVEVDGRERDAYGTKCLTADGSWILGRPKLVPSFEDE